MKSTVLTMPLLVVLYLLAVAPTLAAGSQWRNGLPPTTMDSFVLQAKENAEVIYGDEGTASIPPYFGFIQASRINAGIMDERNRGLTTGHGSFMPDAAGRDEFSGQEWSQSGARDRSEAALGFQNGNAIVVAASAAAPSTVGSRTFVPRALAASTAGSRIYGPSIVASNTVSSSTVSSSTVSPGDAAPRTFASQSGSQTNDDSYDITFVGEDDPSFEKR